MDMLANGYEVTITDEDSVEVLTTMDMLANSTSTSRHQRFHRRSPHYNGHARQPRASQNRLKAAWIGTYIVFTMVTVLSESGIFGNFNQLVKALFFTNLRRIVKKYI